MKKIKKITALILVGVLCTSSLSGIPTKTLMASDEGNGTSTLEINFEDAVNPFVSLNNEEEDAWGIIESPVTNDTGNHLLKLTSPKYTLSKFQLDDEYLSGKIIKTVSGKIAHKKINTGVYIVTDYTDEATNSGFKIHTGNNNDVHLTRVQAKPSDATGLTTYSPSATDYSDVESNTEVSCVVPWRANNAYSYWVDFTLEYYTVTPQSASDSGYRARMTVTAPLEGGGTQSIILTTVVNGPGRVLMFAPVGKFDSSAAIQQQYYVYLDDITVTMQDCEHSNVGEIENEKYLASEGDCKTYKTYYQSCKDCGHAMTDLPTFASEEYGAHKLTKFDAVEATCTTEGNIEHWTCSVCEKTFSDEAASLEVTDEADLVIPVTHTWNAEYEHNADGHWHTCSKCDTGISKTEAHAWENDATEQNKVTCTKCGYTTDGFKIDFEDSNDRNYFTSVDGEADDTWGVVTSEVNNDTDNDVLQLTFSKTDAGKMSKYQLNSEHISETGIKSVSGRVAIKKTDKAGLFVVTQYTDKTGDADIQGFSIYTDNGTLWLARQKMNGDKLNANGSNWQKTYADLADYSWRVSKPSFISSSDYIWLDYEMKYYEVINNNKVEHRAMMILSQDGDELLKVPTVVDGYGDFLMYSSNTIDSNASTVYLDDITITFKEQTCAHNNIDGVVDDKYIANAGDCETPKTYYKSCTVCGEAVSETFTSDVLGNHDLTAVPAVAGDCDNAGSKAHWDCSVCEKKFYDENGTQEVLQDEDLVIPAGHSWNEEYVSDATQHWYTCSKCDTGTSEKEAHTWGNDADNPNKLTCTVCDYTTAQDVLPMICGAKIKADTETEDDTQYLRYDIDFSAMKNNAASCGLTVSEYGVIAVGTTKAVMTLEDVLALSKNNPKTVKSQKDLSLLGDSGIVTVKIKREAKDYGRRTTIVAFMKVGEQTYYSYNNDYTDNDGAHTGIAKNGIASKGVMDIMKPYLHNGPYGTKVAPGETALTYTQKAYDTFWTDVATYVDNYDVFAIWGDATKDTVKETYLDNYISGTMTVPSDTGSEAYKQYQAAKQLAVCVYCIANRLDASTQQ